MAAPSVPEMAVGFNYPWPANRYYTIGPNIWERGQPQPWLAGGTMARNLIVLRQAGVTVVRVWLMADGVNYDGTVLFGSSPQRGLYWDFQPPDLIPESFLIDFDRLLATCRKAEMQLIPVMVDFPFFDDPPRDSTYVRFPRPGATPTKLDYARGRRSIVENDGFRATFIKGTLEPLLSVAANYKDVIYAFDVMNEPWWCVAPITGVLFGTRIKLDRMIRFLQACCTSIRAFHLLPTIGHRYLSDIYGTFKAVDVDRPQHHYYATFGIDDLMSQATVPKPAQVLGEFGSITLREFTTLVHNLATAEEQLRLTSDPRRRESLSAIVQALKKAVSDYTIQKSPWPALAPKDQEAATIIETRLREAQARGYKLAMIWPEPEDPARVTEDVLKISDAKLASVSRFVRG